MKNKKLPETIDITELPLEDKYNLFIEYIDFLKQTTIVWYKQGRFDQEQILEYCKKEFVSSYQQKIEKILQEKGI